MSKGIKMEFSKKNDSGDRVYHISELKKSDNGNLRCRYCGTDIQYVSAYTRKASNKPVAAYLKLWQDTRHTNKCGYSVKGAVDLLVADSNSVEDISPIFEEQGDGSYLFRMNILMDAQKRVKGILESEKELESSEHLSSTRNYVRSEKQLASYFRSAAGVAKLRALIQERSDFEVLKNLIKIQYKNEFISWDDFYYDEKRYKVLFKRLLAGSISHPVALNITVKKLIFNKEARCFPWSFQCYSQIVGENGEKVVFMPKIYFAKESFKEDVLSGDTLLVVGNIWKNNISENTNTKFRNFNISVLNKSQFKKEID